MSPCAPEWISVPTLTKHGISICFCVYLPPDCDVQEERFCVSLGFVFQVPAQFWSIVGVQGTLAL